MPVVSLILGLIVVTVVLVAAMKIGRAILRALFKERSPFADQILSDVAAAALGFMILSAALFALVAFRLVYRSVLWGVIAACGAVAAPTLARWAGRIPAFFKPQTEGATWTAVTGAYFLLTIALSALPPTLNDELIYHLAMPRAWLEAHGGFFFRNNIYAYFPQSGEMFYMLGLGTAGEASARLFHAASGLLLFLAALRYAGLIMDRKHARLAAFALLCVPTVMTILPAAYVDLTFALFTFLAVISVKEYIDGRDVRHALFAGLMLGGAIGVKYTGLQMTALAVCLIAIFRLKKPDLPIFKPIIFVAGPAAACALPWFVRNWLLTGWPMFPFSLPFFSLSSALNWDAGRAGLYLGFLQAFGAPLDGGTLLNTLTAPVRVFIQGRFNNAEFFDGVAGPVFFLVPLLLLRKKARQGMGLFMTFAVIFLVYWAFSTRQVRFLLPVMPFLALMLANGIQSLKNAWLTRFAAVLLLLNLIPGGVEIAKKAPWDYWTGRISRGDYLARENPVLDFYADANRLLRPGDRLYLVHMRNYGYSLDHPWEGDFVFERYRLDRLLEAEPGFPAIKAYFAGLKVTHVMINRKAFASNRSGPEEKIPALFAGFLERDCQPILVRGDYGLYRIK